MAGAGLVAADGPADPAPELVVENGRVVRLDGREAAEFDVIDRFLVAHGIDLEVAEEAMALPEERLAGCWSTSTSRATSWCAWRGA